MVQFGVADCADEQSPAEIFAAGLAVWLAGLRAQRGPATRTHDEGIVTRGS